MKTVTQTEQENKDSIELSRNAKGDYSWTIKLYRDNIKEAVSEIDEIDCDMLENHGGEKR